jgi:hypothetical protein
MYAVTAPLTPVGDLQVDLREKFKDVETGEFIPGAEDLAYWRKFNSLHGYCQSCKNADSLVYQRITRSQLPSWLGCEKPSGGDY